MLKGAGPSRACALVTRRALFFIPHVSMSGGGVTITRTTVTIGGMEPAAYVARLLADPQTTPDTLDAAMAGQCSSIQGAVARPLDRFRRIKIRAGFFRYRRAHRTARGPVGQAVRRDVGLAPAKDDLAAFTAFFARDPRLV